LRTGAMPMRSQKWRE